MFAFVVFGMYYITGIILYWMNKNKPLHCNNNNYKWGFPCPSQIGPVTKSILSSCIHKKVTLDLLLLYSDMCT